MKTTSLLFCALLLLSCNESQSNTHTDASAKTQQQNTKLKRYKVKSGIIKYKTTITGEIMGSTITGSGTENKYFKDYGALELAEVESSQTTVTKVFGNKSTNTTNVHTMNKLDNGDSYNVDFKQEKIYKQKDLAMELTKRFQPNADAEKVGKDMFKAIGGEKIGTETYQGYDCEIWETMGVKQWIYKGVTLKTVGTIMGITTTTVATSVDLNVHVSDSNFKLPEYPIVEQENLFGDVEIDTDSDYEDMEENLNRLKNMSYEDWKKFATANDEEMRDMSEEELRETYDMIQKMIKMRGY